MSSKAKILSLAACTVILAGSDLSFAEREERTPKAEPFFEVQDLFESVRIPNVTVTTDGTVLAFAKSGRLLRRSEDGGGNWGPIRQVGPDAGGSAIVDENTGNVMVVHAKNAYLWRSRDQGKSWKREEIVVKPDAVGHGGQERAPVQTACSESGITLRCGKHKGRLLMPARIQPPHGNNKQEWWPYNPGRILA